MGQEVLAKNPELASWSNNHPDYTFDNASLKESEYNPLHNIDINSVVPVVSGFQSQVVLGLFAHFADPMHVHDLKIEAGYSPFTENPAQPRYHFNALYKYDTKLLITFAQNAPDFYDLFNKRKRGMIGRKISLGYTHYWKYDYPHKLKQQFEVAFYNGVEFINDNLVRVSRPDFLVVQTNLNSKNLRRTIGSSDYESGSIYDFTLRMFGHDPSAPQFAGQIIGEWDSYSNWIAPHNTFHFKLAAGYHHDNPALSQGRFYFGGFGNRLVENADVKQFRKVFRFPGIPIYSMETDRFVKVMFENNFPPVRFADASLGQHFLNHLDMSIYTNYMITNSPMGTNWFNIGAQLNLVMKHWFNLETTFSTGIANAWWDKGSSWEWFLSIKLLRN